MFEIFRQQRNIYTFVDCFSFAIGKKSLLVGLLDNAASAEMMTDDRSAGSDPTQPYSIFNPTHMRAHTDARVASKLTSVEHRPDVPKEDGADSFPKRRGPTAYASECLCAN